MSYCGHKTYVYHCESCLARASTEKRFAELLNPRPDLKRVSDKIEDLIKIQKQSLSEDYMRGLVNGLICAKSVVDGKEPEFVEKPRPEPERKRLWEILAEFPTCCKDTADLRGFNMVALTKATQEGLAEAAIKEVIECYEEWPGNGAISFPDFLRERLG